MEKFRGLKNTVVAAAISVGLSAEAAPGKKVDAQRSQTVAKLQACLAAGFEDYSYTRVERENGNYRQYQTQGWLPRKALPGGRSEYFNETKVQHTEIFIDSAKPATGIVGQYSDESKLHDGRVNNGDFQSKVCYGEKELTPHDREILRRIGIQDCTERTTQQIAQKRYDEFLREAVSQCDQKAKSDAGFWKKLQATLKRKH